MGFSLRLYCSVGQRSTMRALQLTAQPIKEVARSLRMGIVPRVRNRLTVPKAFGGPSLFLLKWENRNSNRILVNFSFF